MLQAIEEIETQAVSDAISEHILKLISTGAFKPGDPLPPQRKLASQLGVSLSSLREALHGLAALGVIEVKHGRGTFVCARSTDPLVKQLDWALLLQRDEIHELMEARRVIDVSVAGYAAERATDEQVASLKLLFEGMIESWRARDARRLEEQDIRFHLTIAEAAGNSLLCHLARTLYAVADPFMRVVPYTQTGMDNHRHVLETISEHNPAKAQAAMRRLLDETEKLYELQRSADNSTVHDSIAD